ncbi:MAG: hypothetical protein ACREJP_05325, partial [Candidatus Methylomirabilales bacterium]
MSCGKLHSTGGPYIDEGRAQEVARTISDDPTSAVVEDILLTQAGKRSPLLHGRAFSTETIHVAEDREVYILKVRGR